MRRIGILRVLLLSLVIGCNSWNRESGRAGIALVLDVRSGIPTRSSLPDDRLVSDINLLIYNGEGLLEERRYLTSRQFTVQDGTVSLKTTLLTGVPYDIFVAANVGYALPALSREAVEAYRYYFAYPDEYSRGIPACGMLEDFVPGRNPEIVIPVRRLMSRVDVNIDRRALDDGVSIKVRSIGIGNCPRSASLDGPSFISSKEDTFGQGFIKAYGAADALNRDASPGVSGTVSLYLLENRQPEPDPTVCSYVEIKAEYLSATRVTRPDEYLVYRFYLGTGDNPLGVERNRLYTITVRPEGDGLSGEGWRVDKSGVTSFGPGRITLHPSDIISCRVGDSVHIWADLEPTDAPFDIGLEELEEDRERGLYDYTIDPDGHGVTLSLKAPGTGIVYFQAGWPVTDSAGALIVIDP